MVAGCAGIVQMKIKSFDMCVGAAIRFYWMFCMLFEYACACAPRSFFFFFTYFSNTSWWNIYIFFFYFFFSFLMMCTITIDREREIYGCGWLLQLLFCSPIWCAFVWLVSEASKWVIEWIWMNVMSCSYYDKNVGRNSCMMQWILLHYIMPYAACRYEFIRNSARRIGNTENHKSRMFRIWNLHRINWIESNCAGNTMSLHHPRFSMEGMGRKV